MKSWSGNFGSGIGSGRVLTSGVRVAKYPTRHSPNMNLLSCDTKTCELCLTLYCEEPFGSSSAGPLTRRFPSLVVMNKPCLTSNLCTSCNSRMNDLHVLWDDTVIKHCLKYFEPVTWLFAALLQHCLKRVSALGPSHVLHFEELAHVCLVYYHLKLKRKIEIDYGNICIFLNISRELNLTSLLLRLIVWISFMTKYISINEHAYVHILLIWWLKTKSCALKWIKSHTSESFHKSSLAHKNPREIAQWIRDH